MTCAAAVSVCSTRTGPLPSAATEATVRDSSALPATRPRTNSSRRPSGDQTGSKSSHAPSCAGPSCPGSPVIRFSAPVRTSTTHTRYGLPATGSPPRSDAKAIRVPSGDHAGV